MEQDQSDPKGLVREAYAIEGITAPECRSIFLDWALSLKPGTETHAAIRTLLARYADRPGHAGHPMTLVLTEGLSAPEHPTRRGGRAARVGSGQDSGQGG